MSLPGAYRRGNGLPHSIVEKDCVGRMAWSGNFRKRTGQSLPRKEKPAMGEEETSKLVTHNEERGSSKVSSGRPYLRNKTTIDSLLMERPIRGEKGRKMNLFRAFTRTKLSMRCKA